MFGFLRVLIWSCCCVGLGIFLATARFNGRTPLEHGRRSLSGAPSPDRVWDGAKDKLDDAKDAVRDAKDALSKSPAPKEKHSPEDRAALDKLFAKGASK